MAIQITREEQQLLRKLKAVMAAEQTQTISNEMLQDVDPGQAVVNSLVDKGIITYDQEQDQYTLTKEPLQVIDNDPEVEQAWENFRQAQGTGSITKDYTPNRKAEAATKHLEKVLYQKGRLTHMVNKDGDAHSWVTEDTIQHMKNRGWREASPKAVPMGL